MNEPAIAPVAAATPAAVNQSSRRLLIVVAWTAMLLLSKFPLVIAREVLHTDIPWITAAWIVTAALLVVLSFIWRALQPLRTFFAIMMIIFLVTLPFDQLMKQTAVWQRLFADGSSLVTLLGERTLIALEALIVLAALFLMGYKRRAVFLAVGDLNAPAAGIRLPGRARPVGWIAFGAAMTLLLGALFFAFMASQTPGLFSGSGALLGLLPLILASAALNAFGEEVMYRAAPLATLLPAVGSGHALAITAVFFGLGHWYGGIPSGIFGFVQTGLLALLLGKAMLDTRGMGWSWFIHVVLDTIIYLSLAAAS